MRDTLELDEGTVEVLLGGTAGAGAVPEELIPVAALLDGARVGAGTGALPGESATVAAMRAAVTGRPIGVSRPRPYRMQGRVLTLRAAVIAGMVVLGTGTAAAATGSLPAPAQSAAHDVLSTVGIRVPGAPHAVHGTPARSGHQRRAGKVVGTTAVSSGSAPGAHTVPPTPQSGSGASGTTDHDGPGPGAPSDANAVRDHRAGGNGRHGARRDEGHCPVCSVTQDRARPVPNH